MTTAQPPRFSPTADDLARLDELVSEYQTADGDHERALVGARIVARLRLAGLGLGEEGDQRA